MSIRQKLVLAFIAVAFIVVVFGYISWSTNQKISEDIEQITASSAKGLQAGADMAMLMTEIQSSAIDLAARYRESITNRSPEVAISEARNDRILISENIERLQQPLDRAQAATEDGIELANDDGDEQEIEHAREGLVQVETIQMEFDQYKEHMSEFLEMIERKPRDTSSLNGIVESLVGSKVLPLIHEYTKNAGEELQVESKEIREHIQGISRIVIGSAALSLFAAIFLGVYISNSISRPIEQLTGAVEELGRGKLLKAINLKSSGEIGVLGTAFDRMARDLSTTTVSKAFLDNIISSMGDTLVVLDANRTITKVNHATVHLLGYEESELVGMPVDLIADEGKSLAEVGIGSVSKFELKYRTKDGREIPMSLSAAVMYTDANHARSIVCVAQDMTERNQVEQALLKAKEAADDSNRAKSEFLANMSHEIRTPMNGVIGMTELVLDTELTLEQREFLGIVKLSADSLLGVINDVLDFSKVEAGKLDLDPISFRFQESLDDDLRPLALRSDQKGLELTCYVEPDVPDALIGDPDRLRQVLTNLVSNAIKFTERGDIGVHVEKESETGNEVFLHFSVSDTGIGISEEEQTLIFEAFTQADGSITRKYGGTGLGLAICSKLVNLMGGRIWVESEAGRGSTFHFTALFGIEQGADVAPGHSLPLDLTNMPVLIVDDNATNRHLLQRILTNWKMRPTSVSGGLAAIDMLSQRAACGDPFKMVLLDAQMPGMDGYAVAAEIRSIPEFAGTIIMMLSSSGQNNEGIRCRAAGVATYLVKPVRQSELLDSMKTTLKNFFKAPATPSIHIPLEQQVPSHRLHILIAEDNVVNQTLIARLLEKRGYSSVIAKDGIQAIAALSTEQFDAVLMDVQMPEMNGFDATAAIRLKERTTGEHMPIIALTAHALKGDSDRCSQAGMDSYVSKPIRRDELFETIESLVSRYAIINNEAREPANRTLGGIA